MKYVHMNIYLSRMSMLNMLIAIAGGPSPAECSRIEPHPPSSPITSYTRLQKFANFQIVIVSTHKQ